MRYAKVIYKYEKTYGENQSTTVTNWKLMKSITPNPITIDDVRWFLLTGISDKGAELISFEEVDFTKECAQLYVTWSSCFDFNAKYDEDLRLCGMMIDFPKDSCLTLDAYTISEILWTVYEEKPGFILGWSQTKLIDD